jgi:BirA family biotin operon repressor/biotin-[acetyl-CoA-carboxylase] ligase
MTWHIDYLEETESTNSWLRTRAEEFSSEDIMVVRTDYQTAGRGCGTNSWESERGKNLLFSLLCRPKNIPATDQFILSMANALALKRTLDDYVDDIKIKWPNDIYWRDKKICGTLIETTLQGSRIKDCIIGTGININQREFRSDAPNPVSLYQILGHEVDCGELLHKVLDNIAKYITMVENGLWEDIRTSYRYHLYRLEESHYYMIDGHRVYCKLVGVTDNGHLQLLELCGQGQQSVPAEYAFKEVQFII